MIKADARVLWREVDGEIVLLDPRRGRYYGIEGAGVSIWRLLQERTDFQGILALLSREYRVDKRRLKKDLTRFLRDLESSGLVKCGS